MIAAMDEDALSSHWRASLGEVSAVVDPVAWFAAIAAAYGEAGRHYHTLDHIAACLGEFSLARHLAEGPGAVALAIWFHDIVYDTRRDDNEARSGERARAFCSEAGLARLAPAVATMILATKHALADSELAADTALLLDIDLSILGRDEASFDGYEGTVREEYAWVPDAVFRRERAKILDAFLARPAIPRTAFFRDRYEAAAQANLARSLATLKAAPPRA